MVIKGSIIFDRVWLKGTTGLFSLMVKQAVASRIQCKVFPTHRLTGGLSRGLNYFSTLIRNILCLSCV